MERKKDNLQIPIKIIQTTNEDTISKIIIATNTQTEVTNEQLMSLKEFHRRLEDFYATFGKSNRRYIMKDDLNNMIVKV